MTLLGLSGAGLGWAGRGHSQARLLELTPLPHTPGLTQEYSEDGSPQQHLVFCLCTPLELGGEGGTAEALLLEEPGLAAPTRPRVCLKRHRAGDTENAVLSLHESGNTSPSPPLILLHFSYSISPKWNTIMLPAAVSFEHSGIRPFHTLYKLHFITENQI